MKHPDRIHQRVPCNLKAEVRCEKTGQGSHGTCLNISAGGALIITRNVLNNTLPGDQVTVRMIILKKVFKVKGKTIGINDNHPHIIRLSFSNLPLDVKQIIEKMVVETTRKLVDGSYNSLIGDQNHGKEERPQSHSHKHQSGGKNRS